MEKRYNDFNTYLRNLFGCRVQKITVDAGMTCPNRDGTKSTGGCIYCNHLGSGTGAHAKGLTITQQIERAKTGLVKRYKARRFIVYFQSFSNTYGKLMHLKENYEEALGITDVVGLSIGTRPDCINEPVLDLLEGYASKYMIWLEYGLQSADNDILKRINRGHTIEDFSRAVEATRNRGIRICTHVILGLPGENREQMLNTARFIGDLGIDAVKIHLLYVIRDTPLEKMYRDGEFKCLGRREYVDIVCDFIERLPEDIVVQRLMSDPHPDELVAPGWSMQKRETVALIEETLERRRTRQGAMAGFIS